MCSSRWNIHTPQGGGQQKFRGEGGGVQKDAISEWVGGGVSSRGLFPGYPSKTGELSKTNSRSVEQTLSYFTVDDLLITFLLAKRFSDLDNPDCLDFRASRNKNLK